MAAWSFLFPVPRVEHREALGGNAGCDTSSGTGVCGWPLAGPVSQPQTSTHPGSLSFGYSLCP